MSENSSLSVLVVEDETEIRELMSLHLKRQGYSVHQAASVEEARKIFQNQQISLFVLDWMMNGTSGVEFIDEIKKRSPLSSVLMVTAKADAPDIVYGLEKGADDYLTKPFDAQVFIARVRALLRRGKVTATSANVQELISGPLRLNNETYEVTLNSQLLHLTPSEFKLLQTMMAQPGKVLTREKLIEQIQGEGVNVTGRTIDTHVFGLRKKLQEWGENIETIRGIGYRVKVED